jgi:maltose O-acetyltransferase
MSETRPRIEGILTCRHGDNLRLGKGIHLSPGCIIEDEGPVTIGDDVIIGPGVKIRSEPDRPVEIGARTWLGEGAEIRPGAKVGEETIVAAGSVVEGEIAGHAVVEGNPANQTWKLK